MEGIIFVVVLTAQVLTGSALHEPVCSKFDYEIKTLEAMLRMEQRVEKMADEMKIMKDMVNTELENMKVFRDTTKSELDEKIKSLSQESDIVQEKNGVGGSIVAFSVTTPTKMKVNGVPTFKEEITNIGGGYNLETGVFTSPVDGLYLFTLTIGSEGKNQVHCRIQHNGVNKVLGLTYSDTAYTTAATSVVLMLAKDDKVALGGCSEWTHAYASSRGTAFSGVLIKQTIAS